MIHLIVNIAIAAWLFVSALVLPQSVESAWNVMLVAVILSAVAFLAFASGGHVGPKYVISGLATWLFVSAILFPHESLGTVLHDAGIAYLMAFVSLLPSRRWRTPGHELSHHLA